TVGRLRRFLWECDHLGEVPGPVAGIFDASAPLAQHLVRTLESASDYQQFCGVRANLQGEQSWWWLEAPYVKAEAIGSFSDVVWAPRGGLPHGGLFALTSRTLIDRIDSGHPAHLRVDA